MKKKILLLIALAFFCHQPLAKADLWGGDLPLLTKIVANTLATLWELERQTSLMRAQMDGIKDRIVRIRTISKLVQPSTWDEWKDPGEAVKRLRQIYYTLPNEYRTEKSDEIERELSRAMNAVSKISADMHTTFESGKELERRGAQVSPGVAEKLTASGVGTLVAMQAQAQVLQGHITSLLAQMLAESNQREARALVSAGTGYASVSQSLGQKDSVFSKIATRAWGRQ